MYTVFTQSVCKKRSQHLHACLLSSHKINMHLLPLITSNLNFTSSGCFFFFPAYDSPSHPDPTSALATSNLHNFIMFMHDFTSGITGLVIFCILLGRHFCTPCFGRFLAPILKDPLKLSQIGCGHSVNCKVQISPQIVRSNFKALAGPLRVIQRFILTPLVWSVRPVLLPRRSCLSLCL